MNDLDFWPDQLRKIQKMSHDKYIQEKFKQQLSEMRHAATLNLDYYILYREQDVEGRRAILEDIEELLVYLYNRGFEIFCFDEPSHTFFVPRNTVDFFDIEIKKYKIKWSN